jgi:hypothetical protein
MFAAEFKPKTCSYMVSSSGDHCDSPLMARYCECLTIPLPQDFQKEGRGWNLITVEVWLIIIKSNLIGVIKYIQSCHI